MGLPNRVRRNESVPRIHSGQDCGSRSKRKEFSARTKSLAWERANGMCEGVITEFNGEQYYCRAPIDIGNFHYDHIIPEWFDHANEAWNCQVLCRSCHKAKTRIDIKNIAKTKRIIKKRSGRKSKHPIRGGRKFDGTPVRYG